MTKAELTELLQKNKTKSLLALLYRICVNHLRDEGLAEAVTLCTARYNRLMDAGDKGINGPEAATERNQIDASIQSIINQLPDENFPVGPPTTQAEVKSFYEEGLKTKSFWKKYSSYFLYSIIAVFALTLTAVIINKKKNENPIDKLEQDFISIYADEKSLVPYQSSRANFSEYEGLWEVDTDSIGYVGENCYNVLENIGTIPGGEKLVFYPIKSIMRIWSVSSDTAQKGELRGIEFVKTVILRFGRDEKVVKLSNEEIENRKVADLGTIFFNQINIESQKQSRQFFNMVHQTNCTTRNSELENRVEDALKNIANYKFRTCGGVSKPIKINSKTIIKFMDCDYVNNKYIRTMKKVPIESVRQ